MANRTRDINYYYPTPQSNGYGKKYSYIRFDILKRYDFKSLLDVGSGPCYLHEWLKDNNISCEYEAYDIRKDSLELCSCTTHTNFPTKKYDMVCMFGTVTYDIDDDETKNKKIFIDLLDRCFNISSKYVLFTLMKENFDYFNKFVKYSKSEIEDILCDKKYIIDEDTDPSEYMVVCDINML